MFCFFICFFLLIFFIFILFYLFLTSSTLCDFSGLYKNTSFNSSGTLQEHTRFLWQFARTLTLLRNIFFIFFTSLKYLEKENETKVIAETKEIAKAKTIKNKEAKIIANFGVSENKYIELVFCI